MNQIDEDRAAAWLSVQEAMKNDPTGPWADCAQMLEDLKRQVSLTIPRYEGE